MVGEKIEYCICACGNCRAGESEKSVLGMQEVICVRLRNSILRFFLRGSNAFDRFSHLIFHCFTMFTINCSWDIGM